MESGQQEVLAKAKGKCVSTALTILQNTPRACSWTLGTSKVTRHQEAIVGRASAQASHTASPSICVVRISNIQDPR